MVAVPSVLAASLGLTLVAAQCTNLINNVDFYGNDVGSTSQADAAHCCADCDDHQSCKVWVWTSYEGGTCWLKSQASAATPLNGAKAGALPTPTLPPAYSELIDDADYWGHDIANTKQKFAEACGEDCDNTKGCQLFVWTSHEGGTCWLKHTHGVQSHLPGAKAARRVSGYPTRAPTTTVNPAPTTTVTPKPTTTVTPAPTTTVTPKPTTVTPAPTTTVTPAPTTTVTPAPTTTVTPKPTTTVTPAPTTTVTPKPTTTVTPAPTTTVTPAPTTTVTPKPTTVTPAPTTTVTPAPTTTVTPAPTTTVTPKPTTVTPAPTTTVTPAPTTTVTPAPTTTVTPKPTTVTPAPTTTVTPAPTTTVTPKPTTTVTPKPTTVTPKPTTAQPCPARVRKPWNKLDDGAKSQFLSALELSMDRGLYQRFVAIHNEMVSNKEAHNSCVFLFWHRKYMLAFEDMLRDLGASFACLTLPYFDWVEDYANFKAKKCDNFGSCSPILKEFGGAVHTNASTPVSSDLPIFGEAFPDLVCADARPVGHFCPVVAPGARCDHCLPRDAKQWTTETLSEEWDVDLLKNYLQLSADKPSIKQVSFDIEVGAHAQLHARLKGPLANAFMSPAEPLFFAHHTAVDMLHAVYHHCKVEPLGLTDEGKKTFVESFEGCKTDNGEDVTATSEIKSKVTINGQLVDAANDVLVGKYFKDLPTQYWALTDTRDFGARAYSYQFNGLLGRLYTNCGKANPVVSSIESVHAVENVVVQVETATEKNQVDYNTAVLDAAAKQGLTHSQVELELRKMALLVKEFCLPGSVAPYTDDFRAMWKIHVRRPSYVLIEDLKAGRATMQLAKWRDFLATYFKCTSVPSTIL